MGSNRRAKYLLANSSQSRKAFIAILDDGNIEGSVLIKGIGGGPLCVFTVIQDREFFNQGMQAIDRLVMVFLHRGPGHHAFDSIFC